MQTDIYNKERKMLTFQDLDDDNEIVVLDGMDNEFYPSEGEKFEIAMMLISKENVSKILEYLIDEETLTEDVWQAIKFLKQK